MILSSPAFWTNFNVNSFPCFFVNFFCYFLFRPDVESIFSKAKTIFTSLYQDFSLCDPPADCSYLCENLDISGVRNCSSAPPWFISLEIAPQFQNLKFLNIWFKYLIYRTSFGSLGGICPWSNRTDVFSLFFFDYWKSISSWNRPVLDSYIFSSKMNLIGEHGCFSSTR